MKQENEAPVFEEAEQVLPAEEFFKQAFQFEVFESIRLPDMQSI